MDCGSVNVFESNYTKLDENNVEPINNCKERTKRFLFWALWERYKSKFNYYKEFNNSINSNMEIRNEIRKDIEIELRKIRVIKRTFSWFLNPWNHGK